MGSRVLSNRYSPSASAPFRLSVRRQIHSRLNALPVARSLPLPHLQHWRWSQPTPPLSCRQSDWPLPRLLPPYGALSSALPSLTENLGSTKANSAGLSGFALP